MTIEELAELTSEKLKALTDEQLTEILSPYFTVTRPELAPKKSSGSSSKQEQLPLTSQQRAAMALMQEEGIDISFLRTKKKK